MAADRHPGTGALRDFPGDAVGKAIPYGVYDMARNEAWVSVGRDHDTPAFAVASMRQWWTMMGRRAYPQADDLRVRIHVSGFPPGTSKWNKIEQRLFCHIAENWRGRPLRTFELI